MTNIGHNNPPEELEILRGKLATENPLLKARLNDLIDMRDDLPDEITSDEQAAQCADIIKAHQKTAKAIEGRRKEIKQPYLDCGREVEDFFKAIKIDLEISKRAVTDLATPYQVAKAEEEQARRDLLAEEARKRAEAELAEAKTEGDLHLAQQADTKAQAMERRADDTAGAMSKVASDGGASASIRTTIRHEITDIRQINLEALRPFLEVGAIDKAIRKYMKEGGRELAGVRIYEHKETVVR